MKQQQPQNHKLAQFFADTAAFSFDHSKAVLLLFMLFLALIFSAISELKMDMSAEGRLHANDPIRQNYQQLRQLFGRDDVIMISLPTNGSINASLLAQVKQLQQTIDAEVPYLHRVNSLLNARLSYGDNNELMIEEMLEGWDSSASSEPQALAEILEQRWPKHSLESFLSNSANYQERLISTDGQHIALLIELKPWLNSESAAAQPLTQAQAAEAVRAIRAIIKLQPNAEHIRFTGNAVVEETVTRLVFNDTNTTGGIAFCITIIFLMLFFRRLSGVIMPLLVVNSALLTGIGFMAINNVPWTLTFGTMPPILIAIGVADAVHVLSGFYKHYAATADKRQSIISAMQHSAPAMLLTSLTTIAGFLSFAAADLASIADLGKYTAIAVLFALLYSVILLPAFIAIMPIKAAVKDAKTLSSINTLNTALVSFSIQHAKAISITAIALLAVGLYNASTLPFSDDVMQTFADTEITKQDLFHIDQHYNGAQNIEIVIDSGAKGGITAVPFLQKLSEASTAFSNTQIEGVELANSYSVLNILKETHQALHDNDQAFYKLADEREVIAQELLLFEMSERDDLLKVVDEDFRYARLSLKMHYADGVIYNNMLKRMQPQLDRIFGPDNSRISGTTALMAESIPRALSSMMKSYGIAVVVISIMMAMMIGNLKIGLLSMIPNLLPIVLVLNMMVFIDWPLDQNTISIGAIALGLVVDDTLHFLYHFKQHWKQSGDASDASLQAVKGCGSALFITTIIFSAACFGNLVSDLDPFFKFGMSLGLITLLALLIDLIVSPALLVCAFPKRQINEICDSELLLEKRS